MHQIKKKSVDGKKEMYTQREILFGYTHTQKISEQYLSVGITNKSENETHFLSL